MDLFDKLRIDGASVIGASHQSRRRNNQDAWSVARDRHAVVAAVADGSSSGPCSEVGARLAARFLAAQGLVGMRTPGAEHLPLAQQLLSRLVDELGRLADELTAPGEERALTIADLFLFTVLMLFVDRERYSIIGVGDGLYGIDERLVSLAGHEGGQPTYCMYAHIDPADVGRPVDTRPRLHTTGITSDVTSLMIATDGCAQLMPSVDDSRPWHERFDIRGQRSSLLQTRVESLVAESGPPYDDATLVWMRR